MKLKIAENIHIYTDSRNKNWEYVECNICEKLNLAINRSNGITESDWSRLVRHIDNGCFMISAYRKENTEEVNRQKTAQLASELKVNNLGYVRILGEFIENKGTTDEVEVIEESFFVPQPKNFDNDKFFNIAIELCRTYNQDDVLISLPGYVDFGYYDKNGEFDFSPGNKLIFTDDKIGEYFSMLVYGRRKNKKFAFTEWLAIRHPVNVPQAVYMKQNLELNL